MAKVADFRKNQESFADYLPYAGMVADGVILNKDGALMAGWEIAGPDLESQTNMERNVLAA